MKNQNDLIFSIVAIVVFLIVFFVCMGTRPEPVTPTPPENVNLSQPTLPQGVTPVMANALPGGSAAGGGAAGGGGRASGSGPISTRGGGGGGMSPAFSRPPDPSAGGSNNLPIPGMSAGGGK